MCPASELALIVRKAREFCQGSKAAQDRGPRGTAAAEGSASQEACERPVSRTFAEGTTVVDDARGPPCSVAGQHHPQRWAPDIAVHGTRKSAYTGPAQVEHHARRMPRTRRHRNGISGTIVGCQSAESRVARWHRVEDRFYAFGALGFVVLPNRRPNKCSLVRTARPSISREHGRS